MTTPDGQLRPWTLTAAESYLLRYGPLGPVGTEPLKLSLQELVLRGAVRVVAVRVPRRLRLGHSLRAMA